MENKQFSYVDSQGFSHDIVLNERDFELVQRDAIITDQKIQTKPTTFFKDALRRFRKNKSSVAGAVILGVLLALTVVLPLAIPYDVDTPHPSETLLAPKLFEAGAGWWDGGKNYDDVVLKIDWDRYDKDGTIIGGPTEFDMSLVIGGQDGVKYNPLAYTDAVNTYAHGGYARINAPYRGPTTAPLELHSWDGVSFDFNDEATNYTVSIDAVDPTVGELSSFWNYGAPVGYDVRFQWSDLFGSDYAVVLAENVTEFGKKTFSFNDKIDEIRTKIMLDPIATDYSLDGTINKPYLVVAAHNAEDKGASVNNLILSTVEIKSDDPEQAEELANLSILDANKSLSIPRVDGKGREQKYFWSVLNGNLNLFHAKIVSGSYRIDTYLQKYGIQQMTFKPSELRAWTNNGWISSDLSILDRFPTMDPSELKGAAEAYAASIKVVNEHYSPLVVDADHPTVGAYDWSGDTRALTVTAYATKWKVLYPGTDSCPKFLFGTDDSGKDMVKYVFSGLRTSLLLGVLTFLVNFSIGLVYGAIAGYFGGWTDILMERFTDILGGVPWIVVMTLFIVLMGNTFWVFALALCMTGWIGTSSLTRTQFYRFKSREYILAARTLGASDGRLIFRHILPNAVGTIVTSSVLMIPTVIFSEATLAYLNLDLQGVASFGRILSDNQAQIQSNPHLILFPSAVMALIMISFNLFGNGLRDAFNPSLKGGE